MDLPHILNGTKCCRLAGPQMYRVRLTDGQSRHQYRDVQPANVSLFTVTGLQASTAYRAAVMAYSRLGDSAYSQPVRLSTTGQSKVVRANGRARGPVSTTGETARTCSVATSDTFE